MNAYSLFCYATNLIIIFAVIGLAWEFKQPFALLLIDYLIKEVPYFPKEPRESSDDSQSIGFVDTNR